MPSRWSLLIFQFSVLGLGALAAGLSAEKLTWPTRALATIDYPVGGTPPPEQAAKAVHQAPANAYHWATLAWSAHKYGEPAVARGALLRSWRLAPRSRNLSLLRAQLGTVYWPELDREARGHLLRDITEARHRAPDAFFDLMNRDSRFAAIWRIALRTTSIQKGSSQ